MSETRRATLFPKQVWFLFAKVMEAKGRGKIQRCIDKADDELSAILKVEHKMDGTFNRTLPNDEREYAFSFEAVFGMKVALVQCIAAAARGETRHVTIPIARALKIEGFVLKEAEIDKDDDGTLDLKFDDDPKKQGE